MKRKCKKCGKHKKLTEFEAIRKEPAKEIAGNRIYILKDICDACVSVKGRRR